nr:MAG TPA: structural protein [Bacteriophage sp.]
MKPTYALRQLVSAIAKLNQNIGLKILIIKSGGKLMASILDRYGIKEVADCVFYKIDPTTGGPGAPVLYLDSLKVSTVEQTASSVY